MSWQQVLLVFVCRAGPGRAGRRRLAGLHPGDLGRVAYRNFLWFVIAGLTQVKGSSWPVATRRYRPDA
jgi:hypothetical protein